MKLEISLTSASFTLHSDRHLLSLKRGSFSLVFASQSCLLFSSLKCSILGSTFSYLLLLGLILVFISCLSSHASIIAFPLHLLLSSLVSVSGSQ